MNQFKMYEEKNSGSNPNKKLVYIINEMEQICFHKKTRDEQFIDFLINKVKDEYYTDYDCYYRLWNCIQILVQKLQMEIRKKEGDKTVEEMLINQIKDF